MTTSPKNCKLKPKWQWPDPCRSAQIDSFWKWRNIM